MNDDDRPRPDSPGGRTVYSDRWTVWRVRMDSFAGEWRATKRPHSRTALGIRQVEMIEVMPVAEHEEIVAQMSRQLWTKRFSRSVRHALRLP